METEDLGKSIISAPPQPISGAASKVLQWIFDLAINGTTTLPSAPKSAGRQLQKHHGNVEAAINAIVNQHIVLASSQGFLTNLGGILAALVSMPANFAALLVLQTRMVACIAHLRGYQLSDSRVRQAILLTLLGKRFVTGLVAKQQLPGNPVVIATAPVMDSELEQQISDLITSTLLSQAGGKQIISLAARKVPVLGGSVGALTDGYNTLAVARYAREQFVNRRLEVSQTPTVKQPWDADLEEN